ncbi:unnamed protein product [Darwinula stevensoni]|uniref:Ionotropic glutamate receptor L-glutamate and glycine-binding domain-containing protein n=1 Tax=Darwinula stevensoni TaxID=69355 RepID=A0A7R9AD93_9CRUS|nr:unnamed protein product [Darwinula stevensoni]CAG0900868.1 unnamed protein product [Darwinula stevensoni]
MKLRIGANLGEPFIHFVEGQKRKSTLEGYAVDLVNALGEKLNFTYDFLLVDEGMLLNIDGAPDGLIGLVHRAEVDFGISGRLRSRRYYRYVKYSTPYTVDRIVMIVNKPSRMSPSSHPFASFSWTFLLAWVASIVCFTFFIMGIRRFWFTGTFVEPTWLSVYRVTTYVSIPQRVYLHHSSYRLSFGFLWLAMTLESNEELLKGTTKLFVYLGTLSESMVKSFYKAFPGENTYLFGYMPLTEGNGSSSAVSFRVYNRCLYCQGGKPKVVLVDEVSWALGDTLQSKMASPTASFTGNFYGARLHIGANLGEPFIHFVEGQKGKSTLEGYAVDLVNALGEKLNFTYDFLLVDEGKLLNIDGAPDGLIGLVHRAEVDFGISGRLRSRGYYRYVKYSTPYTVDRIVMIVNKPSRMSPSSHPFASFSWIFLLAWVASIVCFTFFIMGIRRFWFTGSFVEPTWLSVYRVTTYVSIPQRVYLHHSSYRLSFGFLWLAMVIFYVIYQASLQSMLNVTEYASPVNAIDDFEKQGLQWLVNEGTTADYYFEDNPYMQAVKVRYAGNESALDIMMKNPYMYGTVSDMISFLVQRNRYLQADGSNPFWTLRETVDMFLLSIPFPKVSLFQESFNRVIRRLVDGGIVKHWREMAQFRIQLRNVKDILTRKDSYSEMQRVEALLPLGIAYLVGPFYLLAAGEAIALVVFFIELFAVRAGSRERQTAIK